jgi:hypothetical protein
MKKIILILSFMLFQNIYSEIRIPVTVILINNFKTITGDLINIEKNTFCIANKDSLTIIDNDIIKSILYKDKVLNKTKLSKFNFGKVNYKSYNHFKEIKKKDLLYFNSIELKYKSPFFKAGDYLKKSSIFQTVGIGLELLGCLCGLLIKDESAISLGLCIAISGIVTWFIGIEFISEAGYQLQYISNDSIPRYNQVIPDSSFIQQ